MKKITIQEIEMMGSDSQLVFGGTFEGGIHLQQIPDEIAPCLNDILKSGYPVKNFLEIGAAAGGSTWLFNHVFKPENIVVIDDNCHKKHIFRPAIIESMKCNVREFIGKSQLPEAVDFVKKLKLKFDIILIDGGHSYATVSSDINNYVPFLNDGGFLLLHDIRIFEFFGPGIVFNELKNSGIYEYAKEYVSKLHPTPCGVGLLRKQERS